MRMQNHGFARNCGPLLRKGLQLWRAKHAASLDFVELVNLNVDNNTSKAIFTATQQRLHAHVHGYPTPTPHTHTGTSTLNDHGDSWFFENWPCPTRLYVSSLACNTYATRMQCCCNWSLSAQTYAHLRIDFHSSVAHCSANNSLARVYFGLQIRKRGCEAVPDNDAHIQNLPC